MKRPIIYKVVVLPIYLYQKVLSSFSPGCCRFYPSCSNYAIDAIFEYGLLKGIFLSLWRLLRCHPLSPGGYDPIPLKKVVSPSTHQGY